MTSRSALIALLLVAACAHEAPTVIAPSACRTPMPLELRLKRIEQRLVEGYAHAPPLTAAEHQEINRLGACAGGAVLGVGTGCPEAWAAARASGLAERNCIRSASFSVPEYVQRATGRPLGGARTQDLLVAMQIADQAETALRAHLLSQPATAAFREDALKIMLVSADIQQAIICDAEDQALGKKVGAPFDPAAVVPAGP